MLYYYSMIMFQKKTKISTMPGNMTGGARRQARKAPAHFHPVLQPGSMASWHRQDSPSLCYPDSHSGDCLVKSV